MKIRVTLKDPDTMPDAVADAMASVAKPSGVSTEEWAGIRNIRLCAIQSGITALWMPCSEYLVVEFDTEANTATVLPASEFN